jgi:BirA family biotin operon repressor/biotin-[acetyl-CoA-carboxylase] ligase
MAIETPPPGHRARSALAGTRFADVRWAASTGSTNSDAMDLARDGAAEGVVLVADHQETGRGRLGRRWEAPPGSSLLVSVLLRPPAAVADAVSMAAALSMADALAAVAGVEARLKWPNDLVVDLGDRTVAGEDGRSPGDDGVRKLAGVLAEADWPAGSTISGGYAPPRPGERIAVVVGIGVNVNWPAEVPEELAPVLTSCNHLTGAEVDREVLLVEFLRRLDDRYGRLRARPEDAGWLRDEWRGRSATLGQLVRVDLGGDDLVGTAVDLDATGRLVVETLEGERRTVAVGDVVHLRPA